MEFQEAKERKVLEGSKIIAIVGLSPDREKPSNVVASYLIAHGYSVFPVNPRHDEILGRKSYKSLSEVPEQIDIVDIFMRSDKLLPIVEEAIKLRPLAIWLQLGIINEEAKKLVENAGITFFMNICIKQEHAKLFEQKSSS